MKETLRHAPPIKYTHPLLTGRHPFEVFTLLLCIFAGAPLLAGRPSAGTIEENLPDWAALGWGVTLSGGALITLGGVFWRGSILNALVIERVGVVSVGFSAIVYAVIIIASIGLTGLAAGALVGAFGIACLLRFRDLGRVIDELVHTAHSMSQEDPGEVTS